jgi:hypothetical protein
MNLSRKFTGCLFLNILIFLVSIPPAGADVRQFKVYKEAFPSSKPKCITCHVKEKPTKDEGKHDLNAYGAKAKEMSPPPTAETYRALGAYENFENKGSTSQ